MWENCNTYVEFAAKKYQGVKRWGRGCGQVVIVLAFNADNLSSTPAKA